ncbi:isochorismatase family protein [Defluviimonas aestuarii]|uniref:isochorismatase family protein n=1 Tax=Albidovulum aestuarii TaxID=1130726 RepID=UPI00249C7891|nr:isochorismatase family protein [Defluviimonas aestuarii]MDI3336630.1 isochorismatase family protein [Defluviimonas aestuarii]
MIADLFDRTDSLLCVIDVQDVFLDKLDARDAETLLARIVWLIRASRALGVPVLAMAEDIGPNGPTHDAIRDVLPDEAVIYDKRFFGLARQQDILQAVRATGKGQVILCGLETDVCVMQSALGLQAAGYKVAVAADACGSPGPCHEAGLARMRGTGIVETSVKGIFYEWVRNLDTLALVKPLLAAELPEGLTL